MKTAEAPFHDDKQVGVVLGWTSTHRHDLRAANRRFGRAYATAQQARHLPAAAAAARGLILVLRQEGRFAEARAWAEAAEALHVSAWERVMLNVVRGTLATLTRDLAEAALYFDAAFAWCRMILTNRPPRRRTSRQR